MTPRFEAWARRKTDAALAAAIPGYRTVADVAGGRDLVPIASPWTRRLFDGRFYRSPPPSPDLPSTSLVFVQSRDGNTVISEPSLLGGGHTDLHLVYEGLSRVDADGVLAGSGTARGRELVFSVWHPELVALRLARGHARHPAQIVVSGSGRLRLDDALLFLEPELRVFIVSGGPAVPALRARVAERPWIEVIDAGAPLSLTAGLRALRARGLGVLSCVGGPITATALLAEGLVSDLYLTTSAIDGGEPNTPLHTGPPLTLAPVVRKAGTGVETGVVFEHSLVR